MSTVSYSRPIDAAMAGMKARLFLPFALGKWFALGWSAWLATLGEGGMSFNLNSRKWTSRPEAEWPVLQSWIHSHAILLMALASGILLVGLAIGLTLTWVRARAKFVFLDNVVRDRTQVSEPWRAYAVEGQSLFAWNIAFAFLVILAVLSVSGVGMAVAWPALVAHTFDRHAILGIAVTLPLLLAVIVIASALFILLEDFVVPLMYRHRVKANAGWRKLGDLARGQMDALLLYLLVRFALGLLAGILVLAFCVLTCCCGLVLLMLPYIRSVVMLPVQVFFRLFSLEFLRQFGPDGELFPSVAAPAPPPLPPSPAALPVDV